ncbi:unnamed protein product [Aphanomyces euteiches]
MVPPPPGYSMTRRPSHLVPTAPSPGHGPKIPTVGNNPPSRHAKRRPSAIVSDITTLPQLDLPAQQRTETTTPPTNPGKATWITPRLADELKLSSDVGSAVRPNNVLSLEKSLELLDKILHEGAMPTSADMALQPKLIPVPVMTTVPKPPPTSPHRLAELERKHSANTVVMPQRVEDLYDTITILRQELEMERSQKRALESGTAGISAYNLEPSGDNYFAALGRNAELHIRAKKFESAANSMREDLVASKMEQKRTLDHVNAREEKLRNLIKKNKCLMVEYEVLKDQYVEEKVKSVEAFRTMQLDKKRHEAAKAEMDAANAELTKQNKELTAKVSEMTAAHATEVQNLQSSLRATQAERDKLVLCVAESRHRFKQWKEREAKAVLSAREEAKQALQLEHAIRVEKFNNEIQLLRDKVTQLEQSNQLLKREPHLSPLELTQRKQQLRNTITTQEADLIAMNMRIQELEAMLAFTKSQQEHQDAMLKTTQEAMASMLHDREVLALEQLSWNPPRTPATTLVDAAAPQNSVFPLKSPTSPPSEITPRAPSTAPSPRPQQPKRKGQHRKVVAPPSQPSAKMPTPPTAPSISIMDQNLTVSSWKQEVRGLTEQVEEYKAMIVSFSTEIEKLKTERKKVAAQKLTEAQRQHQAELEETKKQLEETKAIEKSLRDELENLRQNEANKAAQVIQIKTRGAVARYKLKAKLKATRMLQAQLRGFAARKRTDLRRPSVLSGRSDRRAQSEPIRSSDVMDVYVEFLDVPPCVKVEMWHLGQLFTKYVPFRSLPLYIKNGTKMMETKPDALRQGLANLAYFDAETNLLALTMLPPEDPVAAARTKAAEKIQARSRGYLVRSKLGASKRRQNEAATTIQSHMKGLVARTSYKRKSQAIVCIQAQAKGFVTRQAYLRQKSALEKIQSTAKGCLERRAYEHKRASIAKIQAQSKGYLARKSFEAKKDAAVKIQATAKGRLRRLTYLEQQAKSKAAKSIQARAKGYLTRKGLDEQHGSVIKIQSYFKGYVTRQNVRRQAESATKIQSARRTYIEKQAYKTKRQAVCKIQAGVKGFVDRQRVCIKPRRQRPHEVDETHANHRFRRNVEANLVEFRIHCLENPPCVKIEALHVGHVYSTFVRYHDINFFVGFGIQLYHENPETLAKTFEPLCSLVPDGGRYGYKIEIKRKWDMMDTVKKLSLSGETVEEKRAIALANELDNKAVVIAQFATTLADEICVPELEAFVETSPEQVNNTPCIATDGELCTNATDDAFRIKASEGEPFGEMETQTAGQFLTETTLPTETALALPTENTSSEITNSNEIYLDEGQQTSRLINAEDENERRDGDHFVNNFSEQNSEADGINSPESASTSGTANEKKDDQCGETAADGAPTKSSEDCIEHENNADDHSDSDETPSQPLEIPMWLVKLDMEDVPDFKTALCMVDEDIEHLSPCSTEAHMRYSITQGPESIDSVNDKPVIFGTCAHDLVSSISLEEEVRVLQSRATAEEFTQDIIREGLEHRVQLGQKRRKSTNLEELLLEVDEMLPTLPTEASSTVENISAPSQSVVEDEQTLEITACGSTQEHVNNEYAPFITQTDSTSVHPMEHLLAHQDVFVDDSKQSQNVGIIDVEDGTKQKIVKFANELAKAIVAHIMVDTLDEISMRVVDKAAIQTVLATAAAKPIPSTTHEANYKKILTPSQTVNLQQESYQRQSHFKHEETTKPETNTVNAPDESTPDASPAIEPVAAGAITTVDTTVAEPTEDVPPVEAVETTEVVEAVPAVAPVATDSAQAVEPTTVQVEPSVGESSQDASPAVENAAEPEPAPVDTTVESATETSPAVDPVAAPTEAVVEPTPAPAVEASSQDASPAVENAAEPESAPANANVLPFQITPVSLAQVKNAGKSFIDAHDLELDGSNESEQLTPRGFSMHLDDSTTTNSSPIPDYLFPKKPVDTKVKPSVESNSRQGFFSRAISLSSSEDSMEEAVEPPIIAPKDTTSAEMSGSIPAQASIGLKSRLMGWWKDN